MPPPNRWEIYTPMGKRVKNTRFMAFKVPLKPPLCKTLPENERFTPQHLVESVKESGQELKLVIDLTNTAKYYHPQEIIKHGIKYRKFYTVGHSVPNSTVVRLFTSEVDDFIDKNSSTDSLIGVHCTHGVNRTGYLICRYMIDKLNFTPDEAIEAFAEARGHPIERDNYIRNLKGSETNEDEDDDPNHDYSRPQEYFHGGHRDRKRNRNQFQNNDGGGYLDYNSQNYSGNYRNQYYGGYNDGGHGDRGYSRGYNNYNYNQYPDFSRHNYNNQGQRNYNQDRYYDDRSYGYDQQWQYNEDSYETSRRKRQRFERFNPNFENDSRDHKGEAHSSKSREGFDDTRKKSIETSDTAVGASGENLGKGSKQLAKGSENLSKNSENSDKFSRDSGKNSDNFSDNFEETSTTETLDESDSSRG